MRFCLYGESAPFDNLQVPLRQFPAQSYFWGRTMPCLYFPPCQPLESVQCCSKFLHNLPTVKLEDMDKDDRKCMIRFEEFYKGKDDEQAVRLPCTHIIGRRCLIRNVNPLQLLHSHMSLLSAGHLFTTARVSTLRQFLPSYFRI